MTASVVVVNAVSLGVTEWDAPLLDVVTDADGTLLGLTAGGLVVLDETAARPAAWLETGDLSLAAGSVTNVSRAYLDLGAPVPMVLTTTAIQGREIPVRYAVPARDGAELRARTVPLQRGPRGNAWHFRLAAPDGAWSLGSLAILVERVGRTR